MLIPIIIIFVCNSIIILNLLKPSLISKTNGLKANKNNIQQNPIQKHLHQHQYQNQNQHQQDKQDQVKYRPFYLSINQIINRVTYQANTSKRITKMLILISFTYVLLNLPYLITWWFFYYGSIFNNEQVIENNSL